MKYFIKNVYTDIKKIRIEKNREYIAVLQIIFFLEGLKYFQHSYYFILFEIHLLLNIFY